MDFTMGIVKEQCTMVADKARKADANGLRKGHRTGTVYGKGAQLTA